MKAFVDSIYDTPEAVLSKVYEDNFPWLKSYILKNNGNVEDAQDIFQESVFAAWLNLKEGRFVGSPELFNAYIRQICKHKWLNHLKSFTHTKLHLQDEFSHYGHHFDTEGEYETQLRESKLLQSCFSKIGHKCRAVLSAFYYKKQSLADIAKNTGHTEESIKTIKYRCMKKLRAIYLEKHGEDEQI